MFSSLKNQDKCPICKSKMVNLNGRMTCKDCGYSLNNRGETIGYTTSVNNDTYTNTNTTYKEIRAQNM